MKLSSNKTWSCWHERPESNPGPPPVCRGGAQQHSSTCEPEPDAARADLQDHRMIYALDFLLSVRGSECRIFFFCSGASSVAISGLKTVLSTSYSIQIMPIMRLTLAFFFLSFNQMNIKWTSILGCKWTQVQMNGFQLATPACCRSDNSARFPPLLHAWLWLPALISNLFMKREAAFQHGSRNLKEAWGVGGGPEEEHREAKIALAAEKELSVLMHRNRK